MFDEAGYLFNGGRYDPAGRLRLSLEDQVSARIRFHQAFDTDLILDTPVLAQGGVPYTIRLASSDAERYDLRFAVFPLVGGVWQPWPPHVVPKPGVVMADDDRLNLIVEWANGLSCRLTIEMSSATAAGYETLVRSREDWPLWQAVYAPRLESFDYRYVDQIVAATGGDVALYGTILGPYSMFNLFFGLESSVFMLYDEAEFAGEVMDWLTDVAIEVGQDLIRHGVDMLRVGEANASLLGAELYREHVLPRHRRLNQALQKAGGITVMHMCGNANAMLESVADAGASAVEPLTPPPLGNTNLADAKRRVGDRMCLKGNLDPVHVVGSLSPAEVAAQTRHCLEVGSAGGGYIFSVADCLIPGTPLENLQVIAHTVHEFLPADRLGKQ
jgi:hypothetical protein